MESCALTHVALIGLSIHDGARVLRSSCLFAGGRATALTLIESGRKRVENWGSERKRKVKGEFERWRVRGWVRWIATLDRLCGFEEGTVRGGPVKYLVPITFLLLISPRLVQELPLSFSEGKMLACNSPFHFVIYWNLITYMWFQFAPCFVDCSAA